MQTGRCVGLAAAVRRLAAVVLGEQHAERLVSLTDDTHQPRIAALRPRQRRPAPAARAPPRRPAVARRQREIVQYRLAPLQAAAPRAARLGAAGRCALEHVARLGGDTQRTGEHVLVAVAVARVRLARVEVVEVGHDHRHLPANERHTTAAALDYSWLAAWRSG